MENDVFHALFNSGIAFAQVGFMFGSLLCMGIGAIMIYSNYHREIGDYRVRAQVSGLRADTSKGDTTLYYPVYTYTARGGESVQAESDWGSSGLTPQMIGKTVTITVNPKAPKRARSPVPIFLFFGITIFLFGILMMFSVFHSYPPNGYTAIMAVAGMLYLAIKIKKIFIPKEQRETPDQFQARKAEEFFEKRESMPILDRNTLNEHARKRDQMARNMAPVSLLIALALFGGSYYFSKDMAEMTKVGHPLTGELVRYETKNSDDGGTTYAPVVRYSAPDASIRTFTDKFSSSARPYSEGEAVPVLYLAEKDKAMIDRGLWNWALPAGLGLFGLLCLLGALSMWSKTTRI